ncbi:DMT family transporter [Acidimangrovimonas pyrenivorans]|uniref:DMT family transporter n=1 Tax=Acidimangrovimonas pyrenivorans TaxID=2030798 RepID=A0ABV7AD20_9RHOB
MTLDSLRYAAIMLAAGIGIPVLAALNAQLGARLGAPAAAAVILFVVAFCGALIAALATMGADSLGRALVRAPAQPKVLFLAGLLVAFYVLSITWIAPRFGVGNAIFFVLLGQMISAAAIDQFGLLGAVVKPLTLMRGAGIGFMVLGILLIQQG